MLVDLGPGVGAAVTDRRGGLSRPPYAAANLGTHVGEDPAIVRANRELAARRLGLDPAAVVWMDQTHGREVAVVANSQPAPVAAVDGLVTATPALALAVLVADCTPVLLADPAARVVAVAHAGREGLRAGVVLQTVQRMLELGASAPGIRAWLGPAVCGACYEVPLELRAQVATVVPAAHASTRQGTPALDIRAGVRAQLAGAGVDAVSTSPVCTAEDARYYSVRREATTGRFAGYAWLVGQ